MIETIKRNWMLMAGVVVAVVVLATWRTSGGSSESGHWWKAKV